MAAITACQTVVVLIPTGLIFRSDLVASPTIPGRDPVGLHEEITIYQYLSLQPVRTLLYSSQISFAKRSIEKYLDDHYKSEMLCS